mmetsp:Transcript_22053/g.62871  ORF Transcript_22053/g.62871 Transcript_22053/m.62871 type:complete len:81 (-) Transcript_22053:1508-1750(-)
MRATTSRQAGRQAIIHSSIHPLSDDACGQAGLGGQAGRNAFSLQADAEYRPATPTTRIAFDQPTTQSNHSLIHQRSLSVC